MSVLERVAGAPISWGVCEVPGWGRQLAPATVLAEMAELGLSATELGPQDFLPGTAADKARAAAEHGLRLIAAFVPVVLHAALAEGSERSSGVADPLVVLGAAMDDLVVMGGEVLVVAAAAEASGYDTTYILDDAQWDRLLSNLDRIVDAAAARGLIATLHPHVGTVIETPDDVARVIDGSRIPLCLDTGHLLIGGSEPAALTRSHPERVGHVHLKDVRRDLAAAVREHRLGYSEAVAAGLYAPLGDGDLDFSEIITVLEESGYRGWYVLEQDTVLSNARRDGDNDPGPVRDTRRSLDHLRAMTTGTSR